MRRILRYLSGTFEFGLFYARLGKFDLIIYYDADYAGSKTDMKSTSGTCHFVGDSLVSWSSKKQNCVVTSTIEAEYISSTLACSQAIWMKNYFFDFYIKFNDCKILCDNTSAINLAKNPITHSRSKHIDIKQHFLRDNVLKNEVPSYFVQTQDQLADMFTKPLATDRFF